MASCSRVRTTGTNRRILVGHSIHDSDTNGKYVPPKGGVFSLVIVAIKAGSQRNVKAFHFWNVKLGLNCKLVADDTESKYHDTENENPLLWFELWGMNDALERLLTFDFVYSHHQATNARVGWQGQGGGSPVKNKNSIPMKEAIARNEKRDVEASRLKGLTKGLTGEDYTRMDGYRKEALGPAYEKLS